LQLAEEVGAELAKRDIAVACGGLGGVMEAVCRGAKAAGGTTIGIITSTHKDDANAYVDYVIPTGLGYARNFIVAQTGDAVIAIGGKAGTLSEMAIAWFNDKPIIALSPTGGWAQQLAGSPIDNRRGDVVHKAETAKEAVDIVTKVLDWK
jgi:uncharacterized protein (TIGR00725 family)